MTFIKELYDDELRLYKELQNLIENKPIEGTDGYMPQLVAGTFDLTSNDINFLTQGFGLNNYDAHNLVKHITLFSEDGRFVDNLRVTFSFSDTLCYALLDASTSELHVILPEIYKEQYDPDFEIFRYIVDTLPLNIKERDYLISIIRENYSSLLDKHIDDDSMSSIIHNLVGKISRIIDSKLNKKDGDVFFLAFAHSFDIFLLRKKHKRELPKHFDYE